MLDLAQLHDVAPQPGAIGAISPAYAEIQEKPLPLSHYLWVLKRHRWKILAFVAACVSGTWVVCSRITPLYEATATISVDRKTQQGAVGDASAAGVASPIDADQFIATQGDLIRSDSVLRPVVEKFRLRETDPRYGKTVPTEEARNAPISLPGLQIARPPNTYLLQVKYRASNPQLAADVANAIVDSYLEHSYKIQIDSSEKLGTFMTGQLDHLRARMEASSKHLADFERELNVINPDQKTSIQSASLLQLITDYNEAKADRVKREAVWNAVKAGSINAAFTSSQADILKKLSESLDDAKQKFAQAKLRYGEGHPEYRRAQGQVEELEDQIEATKNDIAERVAIEYHQALDREEMLQKEVASTRSEFDRLNARSFDYQTLKEEADTDKKLYEELVRKIREAGINATFEDTSIRIADRARPPAYPVYPRTKASLLIAFALSTLLAFGTAITSDLVDSTLRDPEQVSPAWHTEVLGTLPAVRSLRSLSAHLTSNDQPLIPLHRDKAMCGYDEAIRTVRNSILLTDFKRNLKSVLVTSASPAEGKTTFAAHLAATHAEQSRKTLLIDGDLRRPGAHRFFNLEDTLGLSNVLSDGVAWRTVVQKAEPFTHLYVLPAGPPSRRAVDLVGRELPGIIRQATEEYDLVILDSPPLIGLPEPLEMAAATDGVLVVTRAGCTSRKAVSSVMSTLARLRANVIGLVLNEVTKDMSDSYCYYGHYAHYYAPETKDT